MLKTLIKKEFFESFKTKKFLILPIVAIFFAALSPVLAKFMNEMLVNMVGDEMVIQLPEPTMLDAYSQFIKNFNQMVYFVLIFLSTSIFISDKTKGRLILLLSKPIRCKELLLSKFISIVVQFMFSLIICSIFFITYTDYLFKEFNMIMYIQILSLYFLYGIFLISLIMFTSVIFKTYMGSILTSVSIFLTFGIFTIFNEKIFYIIPGNIIKLEQQIIEGNLNTTSLIINLTSNILLSIILIITSIEIFKRQEIE